MSVSLRQACRIWSRSSGDDGRESPSELRLDKPRFDLKSEPQTKSRTNPIQIMAFARGLISRVVEEKPRLFLTLSGHRWSRSQTFWKFRRGSNLLQDCPAGPKFSIASFQQLPSGLLLVNYSYTGWGSQATFALESHLAHCTPCNRRRCVTTVHQVPISRFRGKTTASATTP